MSDPVNNLNSVGKLFSAIGVSGENHARLKIGGGVIGRLSWLVGAIVIAIALIAFGSDSVWIQGIGIGVIALLALLTVPRLLKIVEKHPMTAVMEGSEILTHQQMQIGMKGTPIIDNPGPESEDIDLPPPKLIESANLPDSATEDSKLFDLEVDSNG